jgi:NAD(P)H-hydrate epimerase
MVILSNDSQSLDDSFKNWNFDSVGAGPGIGTNESATKFIKSLLQNYKKPIVLDADALNILSQNKDLYSQIPPNSILTPHPKEFDRLTQPHSSHFRRLETAVQFAYSNQVVVILKNAVTFIISPDKNIYINDQRNPGLAKGGSGDVLTGIITALLAQEYTPTHAAILGVYIHSFAAKKARKKIAVESLIATDIIQNISKAFRKLNQ